MDTGQVDVTELNGRWEELTPMTVLGATAPNYDERVNDAEGVGRERAVGDTPDMADWAAGIEAGRELERQAQRERESQEHCREHMGDAHSAMTASYRDDVEFCALAKAYAETLQVGSHTVLAGTALSSVRLLTDMRKAV